MASLYNYTDFENKLNQLGLKGQISQADLDLAKKNPDAGMKLLEAKTEWNTATDDIGRKSANAKAEKIRSTYGGYTGGTAGAEWNINEPKTPSSFDSEYDDLISAEINNYKNKTFSYDAEKDPLYSSYKKAYTREGRRASEDTMAQAAAMTGGIPSSYAIGAGQQANNYYASQMADKIPELEERAYNRFQNDKADLLNLIALRQGERDVAYNRHMDDIAFNIDEADRASEASKTALANAYKAAELGDFSQLEALDFKIPDYIKNSGQLAYDLAVAEAGAGVGDYSLYKKIGITPDLEALQGGKDQNANEEIYQKVLNDYGDTRMIPSNVVEKYTITDPGFANWMKDNGFSIELSSADVNTLQKDYPDNLIDATTWDSLIEYGYSEQNLIDNGFKKMNISLEDYNELKRKYPSRILTPAEMDFYIKKGYTPHDLLTAGFKLGAKS